MCLTNKINVEKMTTLIAGESEKFKRIFTVLGKTFIFKDFRFGVPPSNKRYYFGLNVEKSHRATQIKSLQLIYIMLLME